MSWVIAGTAALGMLNNMSKQAAEKKAQQQQANITAAEQQYAPLTGQHAQEFHPQAQGNAGQTLGAGISGGLAGAMQKSQNDQAKELNAAKTNYFKNNTQAAPGGALPGMPDQEQAMPTFWNQITKYNQNP